MCSCAHVLISACMHVFGSCSVNWVHYLLVCAVLHVDLDMVRHGDLVRQLRKGCHFDIETVKKRLRQFKHIIFQWNWRQFQGIRDIFMELVNFLMDLETF